MAVAIKNEFNIEVGLIEGYGGIFRVVVNGKTVFDKAGMPGEPKPPVNDILAYVRGLVG